MKTAATRAPASAAAPGARRARRPGHRLAFGTLCVAGLLPARAAAEPPTAASFDIRHFVTDASGAPVRAMDERDLHGFVNKARCECGQSILSLFQRTDAGSADLDGDVQISVGTNCGHGGCVRLADANAGTFNAAVTTSFHPVWLAQPVAESSLDIDPAHATAAGGCIAANGVAGVWMCSARDGVCQPEDYFLTGSQEPFPDGTSITWDFAAPLSRLTDVAATVIHDKVLLRWQWLGQTGDIQGYRVLCEASGGGPPPAGMRFPRPDRGSTSDGTHYLNGHNLCADQAFSQVDIVAAQTGPGECGDGILAVGEQCDDGADNGDEAMCDTRCRLRVSEKLHKLDWDYVCSDHIPYYERSVFIEGLDAGSGYDFVLVYHDSAGNPRVYPQVFHIDLADATQDEAAGCGCRTRDRPGGAPSLLGLGSALMCIPRRRSYGLPGGVR